jgi:hypothetical protein
MVSCSAYSSTLKMEATCFSETSVDFQRTTRRYITEDRTLCNHRCRHCQKIKNDKQQLAGTEQISATVFPADI